MDAKRLAHDCLRMIERTRPSLANRWSVDDLTAWCVYEALEIEDMAEAAGISWHNAGLRLFAAQLHGKPMELAAEIEVSRG